MLIFWSLVRNSVVLAVYLLFSVACFFTVHEHSSEYGITVSLIEDAVSVHNAKLADGCRLFDIVNIG